jgi:hypothetical protein
MALRVAILATLMAVGSALIAPPVAFRSLVVFSARPERKEYNLNSPDGNYGKNDGNGGYGIGSSR